MSNWLYTPLFLSLALGILPGKRDDGAWLALLRGHVESRPEAQAQDLYKFLYQAVNGPGHMIADKEAARRYLYKEIEELSSPSTPDILIEPLDPEGRVLRVNLRPFLALGGEPDSLLEAFVRSARAFDPDEAHGRFIDFWRRLSPELTSAGLASDAAMKDLEADLEAHGYPPVHHSQPYVSAYCPAYRVTLRSELAASCPWVFLPR